MGGPPNGEAAAAAGLTISVQLAREVADLSAIWQDLEKRSDPVFYLTWDWIGRWMDETGASPVLLVVRRESRVVGLGLLQPARLRRHQFLSIKALFLHQIGEQIRDRLTIEYNGFLVDRTAGDAVIQASLDFLINSAGRGGILDWEEIHLGNVAEDFERFVKDRNKDRNVWVWLFARKPSWRINLEAARASGRSCLDALSSNTRHQIRRSMRLYEARGPLRAEWARDLTEAMAFFDGLKELHQGYWLKRSGEGSFDSPLFERFHRDLIRDCLPRGTVEIVRVAAGDFVIGYLYNFVHGGRVYQYMTGLTYEEDAKLKPGLVSHYMCAEEHQRRGAKIYDFLAGDYRYKASLGEDGPAMLHLVLQRPLLKFRVERLLRNFKAWLLEQTANSSPQDPSLAEARIRYP